jgi:hypothetical protein
MRRVSLWTAAALTVALPLHTIAQTKTAAVPAHVGVATAAAASSTIQGTALNADGSVLAETAVRLRDARAGHILQSVVTDKAGLFIFQGLEPGSYVVEVLGPDYNVVAASQILNVNAGDTLSAVVKLPFRIRPYSGVLGHSTASAALIIATAAASGVLATQIAGQAVSPPG